MESIVYSFKQYYKYQVKKFNTNIFCRLKKFEMIQQSENASKIQPNHKQGQLQNIEKFTFYKCSFCKRIIYDVEYEAHIKKHSKLLARIQRQQKRKRIKKMKKRRKALKIPARGAKYLASQVSKNKSRLNKHKKKTSVPKQKDPHLQKIQRKQKKIKKPVGSTQLKKLQNQPKNKKNKLPTNLQPSSNSLKQQQNMQNNGSLGMIPENSQYGAISQQNQQIKSLSNNFNQQNNKNISAFNKQLQNNPSQHNQEQYQNSDGSSSSSSSQISLQKTQKQQEPQQKIFQLTNNQGQIIAQFTYKVFTPQRYKNIQRQNQKLKNQIYVKNEQLQKYKKLLRQRQQEINNLKQKFVECKQVACPSNVKQIPQMVQNNEFQLFQKFISFMKAKPYIDQHPSITSNYYNNINNDTNSKPKPYTNPISIPQQNNPNTNNQQNININITNKLQNQIQEQKLQQKKNHTNKKDRLRYQNHIELNSGDI